jgi:hypothetical protein
LLWFFFFLILWYFFFFVLLLPAKIIWPHDHILTIVALLRNHETTFAYTKRQRKRIQPNSVNAQTIRGTLPILPIYSNSRYDNSGMTLPYTFHHIGDAAIILAGFSFCDNFWVRNLQPIPARLRHGIYLFFTFTLRNPHPSVCGSGRSFEAEVRHSIINIRNVPADDTNGHYIERPPGIRS